VIELPSPQQSKVDYKYKPRNLGCGDGNSITLTYCNTQQDAHHEDI
jgi:hypothetical protein